MCGVACLHVTMSLELFDAGGRYNNYISEEFNHQLEESILSMEMGGGVDRDKDYWEKGHHFSTLGFLEKWPYWRSVEEGLFSL